MPPSMVTLKSVYAHFSSFLHSYSILIDCTLLQVILTQLGHDAAEVSLDSSNCTSLHLAALKNHEQTIHFLAQKFPSTIDSTSTPLGYTPLILACDNGHDASVNLLLDFGANPEKPDILGNTPLHHAVEYGHRKVIRSLLERGANYKSTNTAGWMPSQYSFSVSIKSFLNNLTIEIERRADEQIKKEMLQQKLLAEKRIVPSANESTTPVS